MTSPDPLENEIIEAFEAGKLKSIASRGELERFKAAARATAIKDRRVNIRLSAGDLQDIQVRALAEGIPYQTLITSVLHKYVTGRLQERGTAPSAPSRPGRGAPHPTPPLNPASPAPATSPGPRSASARRR